MNCPNCQITLADEIKFCNNCGTKIAPINTQSQNTQVFKFDSIDDVSNFLNNKIQTHKGALVKVLASQLQVLKFVRSPELTDTTISLLLENLSYAIEEAESPAEIKEVRNKFNLIINSYIFYTRALIEATIMENKKEADRLISLGADLLGRAVVETIKAYAGTIDVDAIIDLSSDIFVPKDGKPGFIARVVNWFQKEKRTAEQLLANRQTISRIIDTLYNYRSLIGRSITITELIRAYKDDLTKLITEPYYYQRAVLYNTEEDIKENSTLLLPTLWWTLGVNAAIYVLLFAICLLTFWISFLVDWSAWDWIVNYTYFAVGSLALYGVLAIVWLSINGIRKASCTRKIKRMNKLIDQKTAEATSYYSEVINAFSVMS